MKSNNRSVVLNALAAFVAAVVLMGTAMHSVSNQKSAAPAMSPAEVRTLSADGVSPPPQLPPPKLVETNS